MDLDITDLDTADLVLQTALQEVEEFLTSLNRDANDGGARAAILQDIHNHGVNEAPAARAPPQPQALLQQQVHPPLQAPRGASGLTPNPDAKAVAHKQADVTTTLTVPPGILRECVACSESHPELNMIQNSCSHVYCQGCFIRLLQSSLADESLFPPRCCRQTLPLKAARGIIDDGLWARFEKNAIENGDQSRTYCSGPACSRYILPVISFILENLLITVQRSWNLQEHKDGNNARIAVILLSFVAAAIISHAVAIMNSTMCVQLHGSSVNAPIGTKPGSKSEQSGLRLGTSPLLLHHKILNKQLNF
ncbi:hypothetical protein PENVUL_c022G02541 [Penicillium vulpinum]|uniref:RING-type domain-containing protein n=1 Tax=Penicillium vulpinum TaxID=29845 RepID=A0A1V6RVB0_9EURO|nr:hypothetical protein PENVUL_c022G02541 [Penicillium vulpinum]